MSKRRPAALEPEPIASGQSWRLFQSGDWEERRVEVVETTPGHVRVRNRRRRWWISERRFRKIGRFDGHRGPGVLPPFTGSRMGGCLNCGPADGTLPWTRPLAVGFGAVTVTADGSLRWSGDSEKKLVGHVEAWARAEPGLDWRIEFTAMLRENLYQRQPEGWVLVWRGPGIA